MGRLEEKVAIVTGAGRGIGKGIALRFAQEGADIVVNDIVVENMEGTAAEVRSLGRKAITAKADVSKRDEVQKMVDAALVTFKKVDILINNAAISRHAPFLEMTEKDWDDVMDTNLKGTFLCTQAVARHMVTRKYGKIINMCSIAGLIAVDEFHGNYGPAKAGVAQLTRGAAVAFGKYGINVNAIAPGFIPTELSHSRRTLEEYERFLEERRKDAVLGRVGRIDDIANLALFLASDESSFITGQVISSNGGRNL